MAGAGASRPAAAGDELTGGRAAAAQMFGWFTSGTAGFPQLWQAGGDLDLEVTDVGGDVAEFVPLHRPCGDVGGQAQHEFQVGVADRYGGREHQRSDLSPCLRAAVIR